MQTQSQEKYADYLASDYWRRVSDAVKANAGYKCQVCNSPHNLQAHHRSYEHRGRELEFLSDLTCLCARCHQVFHTVNQPAPKFAGMAAAEKARNENALVLITAENRKQIRYVKETWHWMMKAGIDPSEKGWSKRAIGHMMPARFLRAGKK